MQWSASVFVKFLLFVLLLEFAKAQIGITIDGVRCGQKVCQRGEYCSDIDRTCRDCRNICDKSTHNYEEPLCVRNCQDYLHDSLYVLKNDNGSGNENLRATVQRLSQMVTVVLTLVCLMLAGIVAVFAFQVYRWKQKKNITLSNLKNKLFSKKSNDSHNQEVAHPNNPKADLRLEMPTQTSHSDHSPVTVTTSISRRPAEDSTLDYAYDNPAMASPSPTSKVENKF